MEGSLVPCQLVAGVNRAPAVESILYRPENKAALRKLSREL